MNNKTKAMRNARIGAGIIAYLNTVNRPVESRYIIDIFATKWLVTRQTIAGIISWLVVSDQVSLNRNRPHSTILV